MSSLRTRIISAVIAISIILTLFYFWNIAGLKVVVIFAALAGARELTRFLFAGITKTHLSYLFYTFNLLIFALS